MILYFDTETTGLCPGHIIQLSYIMDYGDNKLLGKNFYFDVEYIEPGAAMVHGFTVERIKELSHGEKFADRVEEIERDFAAADLIVSHNFSFDFNFMDKEFSYIGKKFTFKESLDTMRYFTPIIKLPRPFGKGIKYPRLEELAAFSDVYPFEVTALTKRLFGLDVKTAHDAPFDTAQMFLSVQNCREKLPEVEAEISKYL